MMEALDLFADRAVTFARTFPEATLSMPAPELAIDDMARDHHSEIACAIVRARMIVAARIEIGLPIDDAPKGPTLMDRALELWREAGLPISTKEGA